VPMPYLLAVLKRVFETDGFKLEGNFVDNADIKHVILFNNASIDKITETQYIVTAKTNINEIKLTGTGTSPSFNLIFDTEEDPDNVFNNLYKYTTICNEFILCNGMIRMIILL
jgi:hypothetical protein